MSHITTALAEIFHPHDGAIVMISVVLAVFASYVSLEVAGRIRETAGQERQRWLAISALALGGGIWVMHFVAMIGLMLPFPIHFNHALTVVSLAVAVALTGVGLYMAFGLQRRWRHYLLAGCVMGMGIAAMHYIGMAAMEHDAVISYDPAGVTLSVIIAVGSAIAALWLAANLRRVGPRLAAAAVMGMAVVGTHFSAMAAFLCDYEPGAPLYSTRTSEPLLDVGVVTISLALLVGGLMSVHANRRARRAGQMTLARFSVNLIAAADLDDVVFKALTLVRDTLGVDVAALSDIDLPSGQIHCTVVGADGLCATRMGDLAGYSEHSFLRQALRSGAPLMCVGLDPETKADAGDLFGNSVIAANLAVAHKASSTVALVLRAFSEEARLFSEADMAFLRDLSDLLAVFKSRDMATRDVSLRDRALEAIVQGVIISDEQVIGRRMIYANPAFVRMTGHTMEQLLAPRPPVFVAPGSSPGWNERLALAAAKRRSTSFDCKMLRADRSTFDARVTASPIVTPSGDLCNYVWVCEDVTEAKRRNEKVREMQRAEILGRLTGGVAHEFNNLLAVVRSNAEDIREDYKSQPRLHRQADLVVQAADRGAGLVQQLLTYSRKKETVPEMVDVAAVFQEFETLLRRTLEADIEIKIITHGPLPLIKVDPAQFDDALLNLAVNARDAMLQGGTLLVEAQRVVLDAAYATEVLGAVPGVYVQVSVTDSGTGMTPEVARRAFDPFFTTKDVGQGTGLGLSMVYGFAKLSGGHARIYSELGHGTVVKVYLPAPEAPAAVAVMPKDDAAAGRTGGRILLVEDGELLRLSATEKLERLGYAVRAAATGVSALAALETKGPFDLVFSDVILPGMSGADLAREVQRRWPRTKVILTSGYTAAAVTGKVQLPPGIRLLSKPYTNAQLSEVISTTLLEPVA